MPSNVFLEHLSTKQLHSWLDASDRILVAKYSDVPGSWSPLEKIIVKGFNGDLLVYDVENNGIYYFEK